MPENPTVSPDQLRIGLYVHLDLPWFKHPFAFNQFKIKNQEQIDTLRGLGSGDGTGFEGTGDGVRQVVPVPTVPREC